MSQDTEIKKYEYLSVPLDPKKHLELLTFIEKVMEEKGYSKSKAIRLILLYGMDSMNALKITGRAQRENKTPEELA